MDTELVAQEIDLQQRSIGKHVRWLLIRKVGMLDLSQMSYIFPERDIGRGGCRLVEEDVLEAGKVVHVLLE